MRPHHPAQTPRNEVGVRLAYRALAVAVGWLALFAAVALSTDSLPQAEALLTTIGAIPLLGAVPAAIRRLRSSPRGSAQRGFWTACCAALAAWSGSIVARGWLALDIGDEASLLAMDRVTSSIVPVLLLLAVLRATRHSLELPFQAALDAVVLCLAVGYVGHATVIAPGGQSAAGVSAAVHDISPVVDLGVLLVLGVMAHASQVRQPAWVRLATFAVAAVALTGLASAALELPPTTLLLGTQAALLALCASALAGSIAPNVADLPAVRSHDRGAVVVLTGPTLVLALLLWQNAFSEVRTSTLVVALVASGLVALRLVLSARAGRLAAVRLELALADQERAAITDSLTGLRNRRFFDEVLRIEGARSSRQCNEVALLVLDLDHFKSINDRFGHGMGDETLRAVAGALQTCVRGNDVIARFGGEEFVILLPDTDSTGALVVAERCRAAVSGIALELSDGSPLEVTVSIGTACTPSDALNVPDLVHVADHALYVAKREGRDRVVQASRAGGGDAARSMSAANVVTALESLADVVEAGAGMPGESLAASRVAAGVAKRLGLGDDQVTICRVAARLVGLSRAATGDMPASQSIPIRLLDTVGEAPLVAMLMLDVQAGRHDHRPAHVVAIALAWRWIAREELGLDIARIGAPDRCEALVAHLTELAQRRSQMQQSVAA